MSPPGLGGTHSSTRQARGRDKQNPRLTSWRPGKQPRRQAGASGGGGRGSWGGRGGGGRGGGERQVAAGCGVPAGVVSCGVAMAAAVVASSPNPCLPSPIHLFPPSASISLPFLAHHECNPPPWLRLPSLANHECNPPSFHLLLRCRSWSSTATRCGTLPSRTTAPCWPQRARLARVGGGGFVNTSPN